MKKFIYILLVTLFGVAKADAQSEPVYNVPCPEVANLGLYGTIPVSHFTGVPDISIPLYTVNTGSISIPITANYHIAAVKPTSAPTCLGLGWSLRTGGYITRTVRGIYDEKKGVNEDVGHGFYDHAYKLKNMTNDDFNTHTKQIWGALDDPYYELSADEFNFNFCGYTGAFYYNENGGWTVVSDDDIEVEFHPDTDFVTLSQLSSRIKASHWGNSSRNDRYFCRFTLKTPDGCRYEFGGIDAMEFSIPYYSRNKSDLIATSWHLKKITTPDHQYVDFEYDTSALMCDLKYVPQYYLVTNIETEIRDRYRTGRNGYSGFLLFPVNIKSIKTVKEEISFYYYSDWTYGSHFIQGCLYWYDPNDKEIVDIYRGDLGKPYEQFAALLEYSGSEKQVIRNLNCPILHRMAISNKCGGRSHSLYFAYSSANVRKLSLITQREGIPDIVTENLHYADGVLLIHKIPENTSGANVPEYHFAYHTANNMPLKYVYADTDSWGYYNGQADTLSALPEFEKKNPNFQYTQAEILTSIKYPTGGSTFFEYELNTYSKQVNQDRTAVVNSSGISGGLRIKRLTNYDRDSTVINFKRYYYSETRSSNAKSSGISKGEPCLRMKYVLKGNGENGEQPEVYVASEGGFFPSITNSATPDVGYSCVIEETLDKDACSLGYIKYRYSNFDTDIFSQQHLDVPAFYAYNITGTDGETPYTDCSFERGKLLSKEYYDSNDRCIRKETTRYQATPHPPFTTATQKMLFAGTPTLYNPALFGWLTKTRTCSYLPVATDIVEYSSKGTTAYTESVRHSYNLHKLPSCDSLLMSNGQWQVTRYEYPFNFDLYSQYQKMMDLHIVNPVVNKTITANGISRTETNEYGITNNIPYIRKRMTEANDVTRTEYEVTRTDCYGNPTEIIENGTTSVLVWGGYGQKLIARYVNATHSQIRYGLNLNVDTYSTCSLAGIDYSRLEAIRSLMPFALSYLYKYDGNMLLRSQTDANGFTTFYIYDMYDRLRETHFYDDTQTLVRKNIINQYDYHYSNAE